MKKTKFIVISIMLFIIFSTVQYVEAGSGLNGKVFTATLEIHTGSCDIPKSEYNESKNFYEILEKSNKEKLDKQVAEWLNDHSNIKLKKIDLKSGFIPYSSNPEYRCFQTSATYTIRNRLEYEKKHFCISPPAFCEVAFFYL